MPILPDFFIAGAARSGTTSMWRHLAQHPNIFMPGEMSKKEPAYFCNCRKGFGVETREAYLDLFVSAAGRDRIGEASGAYLTSPESPALIREEIPDARIIIMLRNPADRAYSLYKWMRHGGFEHSPSFEAALSLEEYRVDDEQFRNDNGQYYCNFLYFRSGLYFNQVKRFIETFGRDRVHVVVFEEFAKHALETVRDVYRFLEVDPTFVPSIEVHNASSAAFGACSVNLRRSLLQRYENNIGDLECLLNRELTPIWK